MAHPRHAADRRPETNSSTANYSHPEPGEGRPPETFALQPAHSSAYTSRNQEASAYTHAASSPMAQLAPDSHSEYRAYNPVCQSHYYSSHPQTAHLHTQSQNQLYETYEEKKAQSASRVEAGMAAIPHQDPSGRPLPPRVGAGVVAMRGWGPCGRPLSPRAGAGVTTMRHQDPYSRPLPPRVGAGVVAWRGWGPCGRPLPERNTPAYHTSPLLGHPWNPPLLPPLEAHLAQPSPLPQSHSQYDLSSLQSHHQPANL